MKYSMQAKVFNTYFTICFKKFCKERNIDLDVKDTLKKVHTEYKEMLKRTPGLDGKKIEGNLVGSAWFFSLAKHMKGLTPELLNEFTDYCMNTKLMWKMHKKVREKGLLFDSDELDKNVKLGKESQNSNLEMDWKYNYIKGENEFFINFTQCGVCRLAQREHLEQFLPCMCHMDYAKYRVHGAKLIRNFTLANGDPLCDFHFVRIK